MDEPLSPSIPSSREMVVSAARSAVLRTSPSSTPFAADAVIATG